MIICSRHTMQLSCLLIFMLAIKIHQLLCAPVDKTDMVKRSIKTNGYYDPNSIRSESKKDVWVSRSWSAGGMPYNILYMSPHSSKAPMEERYKPVQAPRPKEHNRPKALPLVSVRNSMGNVRSNMRKAYSIPQLFVSYGWGPLGK